MNKSRAEPNMAMVNLQTLGSVDEPTPAVSVKTEAAEATHLFRDTLYMSRTLITPDGSTLAVAKGRVVATNDAQLQYLNGHPDLVRLQED